MHGGFSKSEKFMLDKDISKRFNEAQDSLVIQQSDFSLKSINDMVSDHSIDVRPHYQRRDRWPIDKQSALIESFLLNVPVPPIYLSEDDYGTYSVIDGKQRITAICDFLSNNLQLKDLKKFPELNGCRFNDLPIQIQNALTVRPYIRVTTLLRQSNKELKYEVFLRLNTGGEVLKPQEIRNVAYSGSLNTALFELSKNEFLRSKMKIINEKSNAFRNMDDVEHVLRFFTIKEGWDGGIRETLSVEMDKFMLIHRHDDPILFANTFNRAIAACKEIWGRKAFQKQNRDQIISPLYDAEMVAVSLLDDQQIASLSNKQDAVVIATFNLIDNDKDFYKSISQSTNNANSIRKRVSSIYELLLQLA